MTMILAFRYTLAAAALVASMAVSVPAQADDAQGGRGSRPEGAPYKRVLVVGISPDEKFRCRFERFLAAKINSEGTKSVASCDAVDQVSPLTVESIQKAVDWRGSADDGGGAERGHAHS